MNKELYQDMSAAEARLKKAKSFLKNSRYLANLQTNEDVYLYFNQYRSCLEVVVRDSYPKLIESIKELRAENISLELSTSWESGGDRHFRYGKAQGAIQILFSCENGSVPEQLKRYARK